MRKAWQYINLFMLGSAILIALLFSIPFHDIIQQLVYSTSTAWDNEDYYKSKKDYEKSLDWEKKEDHYKEEYDKSTDWKKEYDYKKVFSEQMKYSIWLFFNTAIVFYIVAMFNYSWKNRLLKKTSSGLFRISQLVLSNCLLIIVIAGLSSLLADFLFGWFDKYPSNYPIYLNLFERVYKFFYINNFPVFIALGFAYVLSLYQKSKKTEIENVQLKEEKMRAELSSLKEQISPHFFFNTLNSLGAVIRTETKSESLDFVENMSRVYRYILESNQHDLVKLKDEIEFLNAYYFLLKKRFEKKLILEIDISPDLYETSIPPMALQLLVENAIQHNMITNSSPLKINIYDENGMICVQNNLQKKVGNESMGIGLPNLLKRYQLIADRDILINEIEDSFIVELPIIK